MHIQQTTFKILTTKRIFGGFRIIFQCAHISFYYTLYSMILLKIANQHPDMQISHALKANEVCP